MEKCSPMNSKTVSGRSERLAKTRGFGWLSYRNALVFVTSLAISLAAPLPVMAQEVIRVLATGVFATTLHSLAGPFEAASGYKLQVSIANAGEVGSRVAAGDPTDLVMSSSASIKTLAKQGVLVPDEVAIGKMRLGVAVPAGARMPDLTSTEAFRALLSSAGKVAYIDPNGGGTSGPFFERMFASLGMADVVHAKSILCKDGAEIVRAVASGKAAIGMTQASEIIGADGVEFAGYLPSSSNLTTPYSASITTQLKDPEKAAAFLKFVAGPVGANRLRQAGWDIDR